MWYAPVVDILTELRDLPRRYLLPDGGFDFALAARDLGIGTEADWGRFLLMLYRLDVAVAAKVNDRILYFLLGEKLKGKLPVLETPPGNPTAWDAADDFCERCPGSELIETVPGQPFPACGNPDRIERWESCPKYRENLRAAELATPLTDARAAADEKITAFEAAVGRLIDDARRPS